MSGSDGYWHYSCPSACANIRHYSSRRHGPCSKAFPTVTSLPVAADLRIRYTFLSHCTGGKTEAQSRQETCLESLSQWQRWYLNPGSLAPEPKPFKSYLGQKHRVI